MASLIDPDDLIGLTDLARELGYNGEHLRKLAVEKKLTAWLVGGIWITTRKNLIEYMRSRQTEGWPRRPTPKSRRSTSKSQKSHPGP